MNTIIFANGVIENAKLLYKFMDLGEFLVAADGGLHYIRELGLIPDLAIGDMDSVSKGDLKWLASNHVEIRKFPVEKDQTDLELALLDAADRGAGQIVVAGALGGRIDQTLANLNLLLMPELQNIRVRFDDGREEVFLIQNRSVVFGKKGDIVSLIPLLSPAKGITTEGLQYPLKDEILFPERSRGISNIMKSDKAEVTLKSGLLLCMHTRN